MKCIFLDSYPASLACDPRTTSMTSSFNGWATKILATGHVIYLPEIIDYELRRELLRSGKMRSLALLDSLAVRFSYVPLTTSAMRLAAALWAQARNSGIPTSDPKKLDVDVILAAQALDFADANTLATADVIVATPNVAHLARFVAAERMENIAA